MRLENLQKGGKAEYNYFNFEFICGGYYFKIIDSYDAFKDLIKDLLQKNLNALYAAISFADMNVRIPKSKSKSDGIDSDNIYITDPHLKNQETGEKFSVSYKDRFKEGEYKNRTQFMFGGEPQKISFNYYGPSVEAVLDKFPMAKVVDEKEGVCAIEADVFGTGVKMWRRTRLRRITTG